MSRPEPRYSLPVKKETSGITRTSICKSSSNKTLRLPPESKKKFKSGDGKNHPVLGEELTLGQRAADVITTFGGSWTFIIIFFSFLIAWMAFNTWFLLRKPFDPFPFILLNLVLSCLAAVQAPIILMGQNRQAQRDRINARYDYLVNRKAEREIQMIMKEVEEVKKTLKVFNRR